LLSPRPIPTLFPYTTLFRSGPRASRDATEQDARYRYHYYLSPSDGYAVAFKEPSLSELARVIKASACIEASFKRGKSEVGMHERSEEHTSELQSLTNLVCRL